MRIDRLDLLKYGKFTGRTVNLPHAALDFHVVVGANEAGKSTLRAAMVDLLYGFLPRNAAPAFLHPMNELRVAASLQQGDTRLDVQRVKGNRNTLRAADDAPLADDTLNVFLGNSDRSFFEQMFSLNHQRLVQGGDQILQARSDIGQILFESAAGVASLGPVREALEKEADSLWGRKSKDRQYFVALAAYDHACQTLRQVTIKTKDWSEARARVDALTTQLGALQQEQAQLTARRDDLERIRRVAPYVVQWRELQGQVDALGTVPELPPDAGQQLQACLRDMAQAEAALDMQHQRLDEARQALEGSTLDSEVLALREDIVALNELRLQCRKHEGDILRRQAEVDMHWERASTAAMELGWGSLSEEVLRARLPALPVRRSMEGLMMRRGGLLADLQLRREALSAAETQRTQVQKLLGGLPVAAAPPALQSLHNALARAREVGEVDTARRKLQAAVERRQSLLEQARLALAQWPLSTRALRALDTSVRAQVPSLLQDQGRDDADRRALRHRIDQWQAELAGKEVALASFQQAHAPVSRQEVGAARQLRDQRWADIKLDPADMNAHAAAYENLVALADGKADRRESTIEQAAQLQAKQHEVDRLRAELTMGVDRLQRLDAAMRDRLAAWNDRIADCGLTGMPPERLPGWLDARQAVIDADDALGEAQRSLADWQSTCDLAATALCHALDTRDAANRPVDAHMPLPALVQLAQELVDESNELQAQRRALERRLTEAEQAGAVSAQALSQAESAWQAWGAEWAKATDGAGLDVAADHEAAQAFLSLVAQIDKELAQMRALRTDRIDTMRHDLAVLQAEAQRVAADVGWQAAGRSGASLANDLQQRLAAAVEQEQQATHWRRSLAEARVGVDRLKSQLSTAKAGLQPLMTVSGARDHDGLRIAIARSDRRRQLQDAMMAAEQGLRLGADGLSAAEAIGEVDAVDTSQLPMRVAELAARIQASTASQTDVSAQLSVARAELGRVTGSDEAARAEAEKQQALAEMSQALERYVKVRTAERLLKWSIDRYRETRQGPMLGRASDIFAGLTLGSFEQLSVDFDSEPLALQGKRPDGRLVPVEGMSEGSRDQLYLALRLAALHLHLDHAHVLPFIADDLFINYDDARSQAGLRALGDLSRVTQVVFLTHHEHLVPVIEQTLGRVNVVRL